MILVDASVWIDHLRRPDPDVAAAAAAAEIVTHPFVVGEVALGSLRDRARVLRRLAEFTSLPVAYDAEALMFIERHGLAGSGIGYVDAHLLLSVRITSGASLLTRDKRLRAAAYRLGVAWRARSDP